VGQHGQTLAKNDTPIPQSRRAEADLEIRAEEGAGGGQEPLPCLQRHDPGKRAASYSKTCGRHCTFPRCGLNQPGGRGLAENGNPGGSCSGGWWIIFSPELKELTNEGLQKLSNRRTVKKSVGGGNRIGPTGYLMLNDKRAAGVNHKQCRVDYL